ITETFFCLVKEKNWIPNKIIVITTVKGCKAIREELFSSGIWNELSKELNIDDSQKSVIFSDNNSYIKTIPSGAISYADDILNEADNIAVADFIMKILRQFTEEDDTELILSIAGGIKTMSALATLAMSMLGRKQDKICHVLVNSPFDRADLSPKFYFPSSKEKLHKSNEGKIVSSNDAKIILSEIPFVKMRNFFKKQHLHFPETFSDTVNLINSFISPENIQMPEIYLRPDTCTARIDNKELYLSPFEFALYWLLAIRAKNGLPPICGQKNLKDEFSAFWNSTSSKVMPKISNNNFAEENEEQLEKAIHNISKKIENALRGKNYMPYCLPERDEKLYGIAVKAKFINCPRNTD
ncbi:MAG TPA: CRISPR-associated ring nuclease Csm6, partial [Victivallales bacterium]|nr:CRISPR-associated ring nuclease Csm6 [Victivallales bacterium]